MESNRYDLLAKDAIEEYMQLAKYAVETPRQEGTESCYGNAAVLLLSSVLDAIGSFYCHEDNMGSFTSLDGPIDWKERRGAKEHFKKVYNLYVTTLTDKYGKDEDTFITFFYNNFRCGLAHNATFHHGGLTMNYASSVETNTVNVKDLYALVETIVHLFFKNESQHFQADSGDVGFAPSTGDNRIFLWTTINQEF